MRKETGFYVAMSAALGVLLTALFFGLVRSTPSSSAGAVQSGGTSEQAGEDDLPSPATAAFPEPTGIPVAAEVAPGEGIARGSGGFAAEVVVRERSLDGGPDVSFPCRVFLLGSTGATRRVSDAPQGIWQGPLPRGQTFRIVGVEGDGLVPELERAAALSESFPRVEVFVRRPSTWLLRAVDARTGRDLSGVSVHAVDAELRDPQALFYDHPWRIPDQGVRTLIAGSDSPVEISESLSTGFFWVSSPGYAARAFARNRFQRGGEIELLAGGALILNVGREVVDLLAQARRGDTQAVALLSIEREEQPDLSFSREVATAGRIVLEGLPEGPYSVRGVLERGRSLRLELFREEVQVLAGRSTVLNVAAGASVAALALSSLNLTIVLPSTSNDRSSWRASILRQGARELVGLVDESLAEWRALDEGRAYTRCYYPVQAGQYELWMKPTNHRLSFDVRSGENDVVLDLSDTARIDVAVPDVPEGAERLALAWGYADGPSPALPYRCALVRSSAGSLQATVYCEPHSVRLQLIGREIGSAPVDLLALAGESRSVELHASPLALVRVSAWKGGGHALADSELWKGIEARGIGHGGHLLELRYGSEHGTGAAYGERVIAPDWAQAVLVLSRPGRYRVSLSNGPEPFEVDAGAGVTDHFVVLD